MSLGQVAGRYTLEREIGRGGMGAVWLAHDDVLGRQVALKRIGTIHGGGASDELERAEREAKLAAKLNHPHVVAVFDFVQEGDSHWLVMEYVEGHNLSELAKGSGLPPDQAASIIRQAAEALSAAHTAHIVHRDVKPSNILVTADGTAKLTDFGIARARADSTLTETGLVTGSPAYLAPEVASGQTATEASDVWSLGATLFQALSGVPPYDTGENLMGALYRIVHEEPPRLADAGWLTPALESTMATDPAQRWSMAQVCDFLGGAEVSPVAPVERTRVIAPNPLAPPPRTWSPLPWLAAVLAVVLIAGLAWLLTRGDGDNQTPADGPTTTGTTQAGPVATVAGMTAFVESYLEAVADDPASAWSSLTPAFQDASGGFESYSDFWDPVTRARVSNIEADPSTMTVEYDVKYSGKKLQTKGGHVRLLLTYDGADYLIDGEPG